MFFVVLKIWKIDLETWGLTWENLGGGVKGGSEIHEDKPEEYKGGLDLLSGTTKKELEVYCYGPLLE